MPAREFTPEEKADAARAVLAELQRLHAARWESMMLALGVREIVDHYGLPWPLALASVGTIDSLFSIGAAVDEYAGICERGAQHFLRAHDATGEGNAASPAPALAAA